MSIQDIKPYAPVGEEIGDYMFTLQTFDSGANMVDQFFYMTAEGGEAMDGDGWYNLAIGTEEKSDYVFKPGEGFMFESMYDDDSGAGYTMAGAVTKGDTKIPVNTAFTLIGNIRPSNVSIQDMIPYAPEGEDLADYMFTLQTFDAGANMVDQFFYMTEVGGEAMDGDGWYNLAVGTEEKSDYVFKPGEGFMFESMYGDITDYEEGKSAGLKFKAIID